MGGVKGGFKELETLTQQLLAVARPEFRRKLCKVAALTYKGFVEDCFDEGRSPYGERWAQPNWRTSEAGEGVNPNHVKAQIPLNDTGELKKAAATPVNITENGFDVVVNLIYASTHQFGAEIVPVHAKALKFRGTVHTTNYVKDKKGNVKTGRDGKPKTKTTPTKTEYVFAQRVVIPARPFLPLSGMPPELDELILEAVEPILEKHFGK